MKLLAIAVVLAVQVGNFATLAFECNADIVFCIDNSVSIANTVENYNPARYPNWRKQLEFAKSLVTKLNVKPDGSHIALVDFGNVGYFNFDLKTNPQEAQVLAGIDALPYKGEKTNTYQGLHWSRRILMDAEFGKRGLSVPKVIVLITDGGPTTEGEKLAGEIKMIRQLGIRVVVVAIVEANSNAERTLRGLASTENDFFRADGFSSLDGAKDRIINDDTCKQLPTTYPPTANGECRADIAFCIDNSISISATVDMHARMPNAYPHWEQQIAFAQRLVSTFNVKPYFTRVGSVDFGTGPATLDFDLKTYFTAAETQAALGAIPYRAGRTNTYQGMRAARALLTEPQYGRRDDSVQKVIVLITDGGPNDEVQFLPDEVELIKRLGLRIVVVYIAKDASTYEGMFRSFTTRDSDFIHVQAFRDLVNVTPSIVNTAKC